MRINFTCRKYKKANKDEIARTEKERAAERVIVARSAKNKELRESNKWSRAYAWLPTRIDVHTIVWLAEYGRRPILVEKDIRKEYEITHAKTMFDLRKRENIQYITEEIFIEVRQIGWEHRFREEAMMDVLRDKNND